MKTNKSFTKRLKVTKTGKILGRKGGLNHFNSRKSRVKQLGAKKPVGFNISNKSKSRFILPK